ncbi:hypothetical protein PSU4_20140 [Pseudonocardia sulfidoxydans NBRC 16205]|uniref:Plasmid pRiA4b Orf3-like domain-containing protein n=1 Tax=Pseudonocardia sulfidoxydans NBRC 16205 TaxID=1223511 RepID=A0A511DE27_9PSEU|nr:plasmid pRiA4b ORF-3 family protein [Pseudonocardia sulfidoxydans]GEL23060.1 hypothetical protein PSU4_20140 [Pseudonocardia sulfidoxydans NBRC 16205]
MEMFRLRIRMRDVEPPVVRVIDVPEVATLAELHLLLQAAFGWTDVHVHQFTVAGVVYAAPDPDWDLPVEDEARATLRSMPSTFEYLYDLGDCWDHEIAFVGPANELPGCVDGTGGRPPEDCGGPHGYARLLQVLADPQHESHADLKDWAGDLPTFDRAATDVYVRQTAGEVPESVRILLDVVRDGVTLTPAGRLPRSAVRAVQAHRPGWSADGRPATFEEHLHALFVLHGILRKVGLLRLFRGVLTPTKAAGDDAEIIRRLRAWFDDEFRDYLSAIVLGVLSVSGPLATRDMVDRVGALMGDGWLDQDGVGADYRHEIGLLRGELEALDLVSTDATTWEAGPSARTLLPRATRLAHIWSKEPAW